MTKLYKLKKKTQAEDIPHTLYELCSVMPHDYATAEDVQTIFNNNKRSEMIRVDLESHSAELRDPDVVADLVLELMSIEEVTNVLDHSVAIGIMKVNNASGVSDVV